MLILDIIIPYIHVTKTFINNSLVLNINILFDFLISNSNYYINPRFIRYLKIYIYKFINCIYVTE